jgi:hypothetical protein
LVFLELPRISIREQNGIGWVKPGGYSIMFGNHITTSGTTTRKATCRNCSKTNYESFEGLFEPYHCRRGHHEGVHAQRISKTRIMATTINGGISSKTTQDDKRIETRVTTRKSTGSGTKTQGQQEGNRWRNIAEDEGVKTFLVVCAVRGTRVHSTGPRTCRVNPRVAMVSWVRW